MAKKCKRMFPESNKLTQPILKQLEQSITICKAFVKKLKQSTTEHYQVAMGPLPGPLSSYVCASMVGGLVKRLTNEMHSHGLYVQLWLEDL